ncbi:MAG TPA: hypothetical protein VLA37_01920 [Sphingomonadaceae bacterium]|nr:hypothetical protein [Sphingomonadaceae bacterium]
MSKQLAISASFSTFAMAAFALFTVPLNTLDAHDGIAGAPTAIEAPAMVELPDAPALPFLAN